MKNKPERNKTVKKSKEKTEKKPVKTLGGTSFKNSKKKKKIQKEKNAEEKKVVTKNRQLKIKIKHLEKELERIQKCCAENKVDKKSAAEKLTIEQKLKRLYDTKKAHDIAYE